MQVQTTDHKQAAPLFLQNPRSCAPAGSAMRLAIYDVHKTWQASETLNHCFEAWAHNVRSSPLRWGLTYGPRPHPRPCHPSLLLAPFLPSAPCLPPKLLLPRRSSTLTKSLAANQARSQSKRGRRDKAPTRELQKEPVFPPEAYIPNTPAPQAHQVAEFTNL